jgi:hypothetical protein
MIITDFNKMTIAELEAICNTMNASLLIEDGEVKNIIRN